MARSCAHFKNASVFSTFMPNTDEASTHENDGWLADRAKTLAGADQRDHRLIDRFPLARRPLGARGAPRRTALL